MKEVVCISGKGGTGKTSIAASFAALSGGGAVFADCDVDAPDLHLVLRPDVLKTVYFKGLKRAVIERDRCTGCGTCMKLCRFEAVRFDGHGFCVDTALCEGCGVCVHFCPEKAILFKARVMGRWHVSRTRFGSMVHAALKAGEENSGRLVTVVKSEARRIAEEQGADLIIVDGPPGIGCPVIASMSGADVAVVVTEPTLSGIHDSERVIGLSNHFRIPVIVCINKVDINPGLSAEIGRWCKERGITVGGRIPYDKDFILSQIHGKSLVEFSKAGAADSVCEIWKKVIGYLR